ncbi:tRNA-modifying protein YgfZ [Sodalis sp. CWE]|uniref:tRNA-modifying protein YgfZ n=1 Tax=Sodalis sp. CWE TaxID=2803816 RepID=UPI001C7DD3C1|nr:tRNA-modifying protein YgfZ [Sodalis sp. CWE]
MSLLTQVPFYACLPPSLSKYLSLSLISLEDWALVIVNGKDAKKYLQGQLTCDILSLDFNHFSFAAHCNSKGKMFSHLLVFHYRNGIALIERRSVRDIQVAELKKFSIFSKTEIITDDNTTLLGIAGTQAKKMLEHFFSVPDKSYPVSHHHDTVLIYFSLPIPRYLLITTPTVRNMLYYMLSKETQLKDSQQWLLLDIESGYPIIDIANITKFIPQSTNAEALNAISFNKGCYLGQETVARAKYCGTNKKSLYFLSGKANKLPTVGDSLELKVKKDWRRTGIVLASCRSDKGTALVQAVLNNNLASSDLLRVCNDVNSLLSIQSLPCHNQ